MPIDTIHDDVEAALPDWQIVRDCCAGPTTVKDKGEEYLPKLTEQEPQEYEAYKKRAVFLGATGRTAEAVIGLIYRKPPSMELGTGAEPLIKDADLRGHGLIAFSRKVIAELATVGRCGILVDYSEDEKRPYLTHYKAEDVINWACERRNPDGKGSRMILSLLVLAEKRKDPQSDIYAQTEVESWRVYQNDGTAVTCKEYVRNKEEQGKFTIVGESRPTRTAKALTEIPFIFANAFEPGEGVGKVPLADLAHVNIQHYCMSADYQNGLHICGIPTPFFFGAGADEDDGALHLGSSKAWTSTDPQASAGFVEFTGQGLGAIAAAMTALEGQMAALGARLIEPRRADTEAFETVALRSAAESSTLARIGQQGTEALVRAIAWCEWWAGNTGTVEDAAEGMTFALNADFSSSAITPEQLNAWVAARAANRISEEVFFHNLQRGEAYPDGWTQEKEADALEANPPMPAPLPTPPVDPNKPPPVPPDKKPPPKKK